jgi:ribonucleoside-diphosphate reductase alpha chain
MSQPLNSAKSSEHTDELEAPVVVRQVAPGMSPSEFYNNNTPPRFKLQDMRFGPTWRIEVGGEEVYLRAGEYPDGTLGELFIDWGKQGSTLRGITSALSITLSQALQHGVPLSRIVKALRGHTYEPRGMVNGHTNVKMATSVVDAIIRIIGYYYQGDEDLVQVKGGPTRANRDEVVAPQAVAPAAVVQSVVSEPQKDVATQPSTEKSAERLFGESCTACGGTHMMRAGSCKVCGDCGTTTGCS